MKHGHEWDDCQLLLADSFCAVVLGKLLWVYNYGTYFSHFLFCLRRVIFSDHVLVQVSYGPNRLLNTKIRSIVAQRSKKAKEKNSETGLWF